MSLEVTLNRIAELQSVLGGAPAPAPAAVPTTSFATALQRVEPGLGASAGVAGVARGAAAPTSAGQAVLQRVRGEVGQAEQPPGSNDSPRIAQYRQATAGNPGPGAWCAYFVSWASRQAGAPLGDYGQGFGRVDDVWAWAQGAGRTTQTPAPGDLVVWDEHIGIVESVRPDGSITTVEGNSSDQVAQRTYGPDHGGAVGFVRIG
jgi:hypothetical protein